MSKPTPKFEWADVNVAVARYLSQRKISLSNLAAAKRDAACGRLIEGIFYTYKEIAAAELELVVRKLIEEVIHANAT